MEMNSILLLLFLFKIGKKQQQRDAIMFTHSLVLLFVLVFWISNYTFCTHSGQLRLKGWPC